MKDAADPNAKSSAKPVISRHYNASQLRFDTWDRLKYAIRRLVERHQTSRSSAKLHKSIEHYFEILEPIESYWAFPGKRIMRELQDLYQAEKYQQFADAVYNVVRMLVSEDYRYSATPLQNSLEDKILMNPATLEERRHASSQHYFEVLVVDNMTIQEEASLRSRLMQCMDESDRFVYDVVIAPSFEDALIAVMINHNIQCVVMPHNFPMKSRYSLEILQQYTAEVEEIDLEDSDETHLGPILGSMIKRLRPELDCYLIINSGVEDVATQVYRDFRRVFYRQENYLELHLSILRGVNERYNTPFFNALKDYSQRPTGVFHAMPISRGNSVFKSHWIKDMGDFYGRNIFLAETSATTGGLDSLLQPTGTLKRAQEMAARAFGAQHTFFVTNGTSTANKIVVQALIQPGDIVLVDRDCHKSHHYGLVLAGAYPVYLDSYPNEQYSMYGAVPLREIKRKLIEFKRAGKLDQVKMLLLTNCTFDGLVYNVERVMEEVLAIKPDMIFLWDEAWFCFARFTPTYRRRTAMDVAKRLEEKYSSEAYRSEYEAFKFNFEQQDPDDIGTWLYTELKPHPDQVRIRAYATQSTHKKMSSLRQGSMIHIYDQDYQRKVEDTFHEAYMTHTSTSPNYQILASLDVARRQAELEGFEMVQKSIEMAMILRAKIAENELLQKYFRILSPQDLVPEMYRQSKIERYYDPDHGWSQMEDAWNEDEFVLDPTHITLYLGKAGIDGDTFKNRYLMDQFGIQINKTSRNTVLFMTNIGTTRSAIAFLISAMLNIARQLEDEERAYNQAEKEIHKNRVLSLTEDLPPLPDFSAFHRRFRPNPDTSEGDIRAAYFMAYNEDKCEFLKLDGTIEKAIKSGRQVVSTSFIIPYPPGFPILVPGQIVSVEILDFLKALDVKEIHGYRPMLGLRVFTEAALNDGLPPASNGASKPATAAHETVDPQTASGAEEPDKVPTDRGTGSAAGSGAGSSGGTSGD